MGTHQLFPAPVLATVVGQFCFKHVTHGFCPPLGAYLPTYLRLPRLPLPLLSDVGHDVANVRLVLRPAILRPVCSRVRRIIALVVRVPLHFHPS